MPALRIGVQLASLGLPLKQALFAAAQLGVRGIALDARTEVRPGDLSQTAARHLRKTLQELNLRVCAVSFPTRRGYDVADDLERRVAATKAAMKMAYELGADVVINHVGRVPTAPGDDEPASAAWQTMVEALSDVGRFGLHVGARLAAEVATDSGEDIARLIAALPPGSLGASLNPGRMVINGLSPLEAIAALKSDIAHVQATDGVRDSARGRGGEVALGRGLVDYPTLLGALEEHNYRGYFTLERHGAADPVAALRQSVEYLQSM